MGAENTNESIEALLPAAARIVTFVCRRRHLGPDDAEEFSSFVQLKIVEKGHSILGGFRGRSSFETYLSVVVQRLFLDFRAERWGRRQPPLIDKRFAPRGAGGEPGEDPPPFDPAAPPASDPVAADEDQAAVDRLEQVLERALATLPVQDRLIVRLHFFEGLTIASVATVLKLSQKPLYRRVDRILRSLREQLESAGVDPKTIASLIGRAEFGVGLGGNSTVDVGKRTDDASMES